MRGSLSPQPTAIVPGCIISSRESPQQSKTERARASLTVLAEDERPVALRVAVTAAGLLAVGVLVGALTVHDLHRRGGSLPGALFLALVLGALAVGMHRKRYWAVLAFEGLLAFQILVTSIALIVASTLRAATLCVVTIAVGGWLFWKLIRVMGRIQAADRDPHESLR